MSADESELDTKEATQASPGAPFKSASQSQSVKPTPSDATGITPQGIRSRWSGGEQTPINDAPVIKKRAGKSQRVLFIMTLLIVAPLLAVFSAVLADPRFSHCLSNPKEGAVLVRAVGRLCKTSHIDFLAEALFHEAYSLNPDDPQPWTDIAFMKQERGDLAGAEAEYLAINKVIPSARSYNNLGCIYQNYGQNNKAIDCFTSALKLDPHWAFASNNRGDCYLTARKYDLAVADFSQSIKDCYATAYFGRMKANTMLGRNDLVARDKAIVDLHHYQEVVFGFMRPPPANEL